MDTFLLTQIQNCHNVHKCIGMKPGVKKYEELKSFVWNNSFFHRRLYYKTKVPIWLYK